MSDILYSFRRCPYAMRARLALKVSGANPQMREIVLRNKPAHMLDASPKGTIPVLITETDGVIDESLDIMYWALRRNDPDGWLSFTDQSQQDQATQLIKDNDTIFKAALDRYKYPGRFTDDADEAQAIYTENRHKVEQHFEALDTLLSANNGVYLNGSFNIADAAILPFIRQAAHVDRDWFDGLPYPHLQKWLHNFKNGTLFTAIMTKLSPWAEGDPVIYFQDCYKNTNL